MKDYGTLRSNQRDAIELADEIARGRFAGEKVFAADVVPGGGKTRMAAVFNDRLADHGLIDRVFLVVPNNALAEQVRGSFHDLSSGLERILKDAGSQQIMRGMGTPFGNVATYAWCAADHARALRRVAGKRTLLILDEIQCLSDELPADEEDSPEDKAERRRYVDGVRQLVDAAAYVLGMSGTLWRGDGMEIPFIRYEKGIPKAHIAYSRHQALSERAILPMAVHRFDGESHYEHQGKDQRHDLSSVPKKEQSRALHTALNDPDYADKLIADALRDWEGFCRYQYASKAIVCVQTQKEALRVQRLIARTFPTASPILAVQRNPQADADIKEFRLRRANVMVTVRKAFMGLDVPSATHLVYLGKPRTPGFLDQTFARVTRVNKECGLSWEQQEARIFVPDDPSINDYLDRIYDEQAHVAREPGRKSGGVGSAPKRSTFIPIEAVQTSTRLTNNGIEVPSDLMPFIDQVDANPELRALDTRTKIQFAKASRKLWQTNEFGKVSEEL